MERIRLPNHLRKNEGFSLLELLLVLSILTILGLVIMPIGHHWMKKQTEEDAIDSFMTAIYEIQLHAMAYEKITMLAFTNNYKTYYWGLPPREEFSRVDFPPTLQLNLSSNLKRVEFDPRGRILQSGRLTFNTSTGLADIRMQLHRGRMIYYRHP